MQIKRSIEKIPGGMMLVPLFLGALCHTFSPGAGKYFGSFTNGMITGTVPILAVWFFCMGASIKLSATGTVLRKSGTLVVTKIAVACVLFRNMVLKLDSLPDFQRWRWWRRWI